MIDRLEANDLKHIEVKLSGIDLQSTKTQGEKVYFRLRIHYGLTSYT